MNPSSKLGKIVMHIGAEKKRPKRKLVISVCAIVLVFLLLVIFVKGVVAQEEKTQQGVSADVLEQKKQLQSDMQQKQKSFESTHDVVFAPETTEGKKVGGTGSVDEFLKTVMGKVKTNPAEENKNKAGAEAQNLDTKTLLSANENANMQSILHAINSAPAAVKQNQPDNAHSVLPSEQTNANNASDVGNGSRQRKKTWSGQADESNSLFAGKRYRNSELNTSAIVNSRSNKKNDNPILAMGQKFLDQIKTNGFDAKSYMSDALEQSSTPDKSGDSFPTLLYSEFPAIKMFEGEWIDGVLTNKVIADTESSPLIVNVCKDLFDNDGKYVVIPEGTRMIGYSKVSSYEGAARLFVWFERMILPNGIDIRFPEGKKGMAADMEGALGVVSAVNRHFFLKFGNALMFGLIDGMAGFAQSRVDPSSGYAYFLERSANNVNRINTNIFQQRTNIVPTITIKAGKKIKVYLASDLLISAYDLIQNRHYAK